MTFPFAQYSDMAQKQSRRLLGCPFKGCTWAILIFGTVGTCLMCCITTLILGGG